MRHDPQRHAARASAGGGDVLQAEVPPPTSQRSVAPPARAVPDARRTRMPAGGQRHGRIVQGRLTADPRECPPPPQVLLDSYALELQWLDRTLVAMRDEIHNTEELLRCVRVCARASVLPLAASSVRACVRACVSTPYARSQLQMDLCARVRRHARARIIMHA